MDKIIEYPQKWRSHVHLRQWYPFAYISFVQHLIEVELFVRLLKIGDPLYELDDHHCHEHAHYQNYEAVQKYLNLTFYPFCFFLRELLSLSNRYTIFSCVKSQSILGKISDSDRPFRTILYPDLANMGDLPHILLRFYYQLLGDVLLEQVQFQLWVLFQIPTLAGAEQLVIVLAAGIFCCEMLRQIGIVFLGNG